MEANKPDSTNLTDSPLALSAFVPDLSQYTPPTYTNDPFWRKAPPLFSWNGPTQAELDAHKNAFILEQQTASSSSSPNEIGNADFSVEAFLAQNPDILMPADSDIAESMSIPVPSEEDSSSPSQEFVKIEERSPEPESPKNELSMLPLIRSDRIFSDPVEENKASALQVAVETAPEFALLPLPILMREMTTAPLPILPRPNRSTYSSVVQGIKPAEKSPDFLGCFPSFKSWDGSDKTAKLELKTPEKTTASKRRHRKKA